MRHRHLDYDPATPLHERGLAAIDDALHHGDLADWAPLLAAVAADPHGPLAQRILTLVDHAPAYGTARLWRSWIARLRARTPAARVSLGDARRRRGLRQADVAARLGATQPDISKLEARADLRVSTLRAFVAATGGTLRLIAHYPDEDVRLTITEVPARLRVSGSAGSDGEATA